MGQEATTKEPEEETRRGSYLAILLAIIYSTVLNLRLPPTHSHQALPSLPLRHSNLFTLLPIVVFESFLISRLSHSTFTSFGACLHLLKIPLLSTTYKYFNIGFKSEICKSLSFDLINYVGQFLLFYVFSRTTNKGTRRKGASTTGAKRMMKTNTKGGVQSIEGEDGSGRRKESEKYKLEKEEIITVKKVTPPQAQSNGKNNLFLMSLLIWIFISLLDGVINFVFEKTLSPMIHSDVQEYIKKLELDQYFLLKSSGTTTPVSEILRGMPPRDRTMMEHQVVSLMINLPYFFSSASLISMTSDFILLDRLPMFSLNTKLLWLFTLIFRRLLNSTLAYFLKS